MIVICGEFYFGIVRNFQPELAEDKLELYAGYETRIRRELQRELAHYFALRQALGNLHAIRAQEPREGAQVDRGG